MLIPIGRHRAARHPNLSWLHTVFGRTNRATHLILHFLLIGFLFGSADRFASANLQSLCRASHRVKTAQDHPNDSAITPCGAARPCSAP